MATDPSNANHFRKTILRLSVRAGLILFVVQFVVIGSIMAVSGQNLQERVFFGILICCHGFLTFMGVIYFLGILRVLNFENQTGATEPGFDTPLLKKYPPVAVVVCSYKEPIEVIRNTMICFRNLTYPAKHLFLLDDTRYDRGDPEQMAAYRAEVDQTCKEIGVNVFRRAWHGAKAGMINDFLDYLGGRIRPDFVMTPFQENPPKEPPEFLAVFDADMNPISDFVEPLMALLVADENLAFVQTPQYYTNVLENRVAHGSAAQQLIFYEYICESKGLASAVPCCGTNVMFRIRALESVGGMDESSVTEDFATSLKLHVLGWRSLYLNRVSAFGMGPQDLAGYFKQQFRWALGSVGLLRLVVLNFFKNPRALSSETWLSYLSSVSYYCIGWIWFVLWLAPILFLFFGFPRELAAPQILLAVFLPYFTCVNFAFMYSLGQRGYRFGNILTLMSINAMCFPIFMKASLQALLGVRGSFGITPKSGADSLPLFMLWPQLTVITVSVLAVVWGANHLLYGTMGPAAFFMNAFFCVYNGGMVAMVIYFNNPTHPIRLWPRTVRAA